VTPRCPSTRWEKCAYCGDVRPGAELVHVSRWRPERKRGWVCARHVMVPYDGAVADLGEEVRDFDRS